MRSKTILIVLHSIGESGQFRSFGGFYANISSLNLNLSEKMEKIAWKIEHMCIVTQILETFKEPVKSFVGMFRKMKNQDLRIKIDHGQELC